MMDYIENYRQIKHIRLTSIGKKNRKAPWYMLTKIELKVMIKESATRKMSKDAYIGALIMHKLTRWEREHPRPCRDDDLFVGEFMPIWEEQRRKAHERIYRLVTGTCDTLPRFTSLRGVTMPTLRIAAQYIETLYGINSGSIPEQGPSKESKNHDNKKRDSCHIRYRSISKRIPLYLQRYRDW